MLPVSISPYPKSVQTYSVEQTLAPFLAVDTICLFLYYPKARAEKQSQGEKQYSGYILDILTQVVGGRSVYIDLRTRGSSTSRSRDSG